jgi:hypothetical protein
MERVESHSRKRVPVQLSFLLLLQVRIPLKHGIHTWDIGLHWNMIDR